MGWLFSVNIEIFKRRPNRYEVHKQFVSKKNTVKTWLLDMNYY